MQDQKLKNISYINHIRIRCNSYKAINPSVSINNLKELKTNTNKYSMSMINMVIIMDRF